MGAIRAVVLIGGGNKGTRMRPLSLDTPKPLLPIGGKPMVYHPLLALSKVQGLSEIFLVGSYEDNLMADFIKSTKREFPNLKITYLREYRALGTAGGLYHFRDTILPNLDKFFVINADVCSSFPLEEMLDLHSKHRGVGTIMGVTVPQETATKYGCIVHEPSSNQVLHYVEKPEKWISSLINGGIYLFDKSFFEEVKSAMDLKQKTAAEDPFGGEEEEDILRLEQDVIVPLASAKKLFVYESKDFWRQIKTAASAVPASALYLAQFQKTSPKLLSQPSKAGSGGPTIISPVYIHPTAEVDETAKIGPNVSVGPAVRISAGARVKDAILMEGAFLDKHACVQNAIVGMNSKIGQWGRVDGEPARDGKKLDITILASDVTVARETNIRSCIVLPSKTLTHSAQNQVLL